MKIYFCKYQTPIKTIYLYADEESLIGIFFRPYTNAKATTSNSITDKAVKQVNEYFEGKRKTFDLPLKISGTEFQKAVWKKLQKIPYGQTRSYVNIAIQIGSAKSCRAVGTANKKNNFPILIPCHRVIKSTGETGGYAGGSEMKKFLLELEKRPQ